MWQCNLPAKSGKSLNSIEKELRYGETGTVPLGAALCPLLSSDPRARAARRGKMHSMLEIEAILMNEQDTRSLLCNEKQNKLWAQKKSKRHRNGRGLAAFYREKPHGVPRIILLPDTICGGGSYVPPSHVNATRSLISGPQIPSFAARISLRFSALCTVSIGQ